MTIQRSQKSAPGAPSPRPDARRPASKAPQPAPGERSGSAIVICTKDRPEDIGRSCAAAHAIAPLTPIVVVDASSGEATERVCEQFAPENGSAGRLIYHRASRSGLARQRNEAIELCRKLGVEIVHFIDDDTEVLESYFEAIERRFAQDPTVMGLGGIIVNQPVFSYLPLRSFFLLRSRRRGVVLRSGRNMLGQYPGTDASDPVEWLNGCSMSYRMAAFEELRFDDRLQGPSLGEDYDFSFRLSRTHKIAVEPAARCIHHLTENVRSSRRATAREGAENTYRWVRENRALGASPAAFWWATFGEVIIHVAAGLACRRRESFQEIAGIFDAVGAIVRRRLP
jgi:GT2 family glycosyltransferase